MVFVNLDYHIWRFWSKKGLYKIQMRLYLTTRLSKLLQNRKTNPLHLTGTKFTCLKLLLRIEEIRATKRPAMSDLFKYDNLRWVGFMPFPIYFQSRILWPLYYDHSSIWVSTFIGQNRIWKRFYENLSSSRFIYIQPKLWK